MVALASSAQAPNAATGADSDMVFIHSGTIQIGIDPIDIPRYQQVFGIKSPRLFQDEIPKHSVTISDFYLDKYPVTNEQFKQFIDANPQWQPGHIAPELDNGNYLRHWTASSDFTSLAIHPVVNVNWYAAVAYCHAQGKRLPTEAEWEFATRAGRNTLFPWGDESVDKSRANSNASGLGTTTPVGSYPPNPFGLYDMAGNVWQFMADEYKPYEASPQNNPIAGGNRFTDGKAFLQATSRRVIRGGSFGGAPVNLWVEYRDSHPPNGSREFVGFRCAK